MAGKLHTWLISPKSFIQLIGAEYELLKKAGGVTLLRFYISAVSILLIMLVSAFSIFYAMELLFHMLHVEVLLAIFTSVLFVFIYIFLLHTFSKNPLQTNADQTAGKKWWSIRLADMVRLSFIVLLAFLVSKPVEVYVFEKRLEKEVVVYRQSIVKEYSARISALYDRDIKNLETKITRYQALLNGARSPDITEEITRASAEIGLLKNKQSMNIARAEQRVQQADFFLFRVNTICNNPVSWAICGGMVVLFLLPGFLIRSISAGDTYYQLKKKAEEAIIIEEYKAFSNWYTKIFKEKFGLDRVYYTDFEDPPFNTKRKPRPAFLSQADFLKKYSGN